MNTTLTIEPRRALNTPLPLLANVAKGILCDVNDMRSRQNKAGVRPPPWAARIEATWGSA